MKQLLKHMADNEVKINIPCRHCQPSAPITGLAAGYVRITEPQLGHESGAKNTAAVVERSFNRQLVNSGFTAKHITQVDQDHWFEVSEVPAATEPTK